MRVLLTGAFGSLGPAFARRAIAAGHTLTCFDLPTRKNRGKARRLAGRAEIVWGDVAEFSGLCRAAEGQDAVVHLAGLLPPATDAFPDRAEAVNVGGTRNLVRAIRETGARAHLVYPSSVSVYGPVSSERPPRRIGDPLVPTDRYSRHKIACEEEIAGSGLRWTVLRLGVSIVPGTLSGDTAILRSLFEVAADNRMELIHPEDVATALTNALGSDAVIGRRLNLGGGPSCRIRHRQLFDAVFGALGVAPLPDDAFGRGSYYTDWLDSAETEALLGYQTRSFADFSRECRDEVAWLRRLLLPVRPLVRRRILSFSCQPGRREPAGRT